MRKLLMFHVKLCGPVAAHATKKNAKRRHTNHLFLKEFVSIFEQFGAMFIAARSGAFGARGNNELELYIGEPVPWNFWRSLHRTSPFPVWRPVGLARTFSLRENYNNQGGAI